MTAPRDTIDRRMLDLAARSARRAAGVVEPNPMVGAVIADARGAIVGVGHHRKFGGAHAEVEALRACAAAGREARGGTIWVTLEPCAHHGKTPPCADAVIAAGLARVVIARRDPNKVSTGGLEKLRAAGIDVRVTDASRAATRLSDPFVKRVTTGLPWVIVKWAQTIDGRIATAGGESRWISGEASRRAVHRLRSRVDAVLTGAGTVAADDPELTARDVSRVRRVAARVVVDSGLRTGAGAKLLERARGVPAVFFAGDAAAEGARAGELRSRGAEVVATPLGGDGRVELKRVLEWLARERDATNVLVEAGPTLVGALLREGLVDELRVFVAPMVMGDVRARAAVEVGEVARLGDVERWELRVNRRVGGDVELVYRRRG